MTSQIFISYSKKDSEITTRLANDLREKKFKVWFDTAIGGGEQWRDAIETTLKAAEEVIVVLSPNSIDSDWVQYEGTVAYTLGKRIIPILVADLEESQQLPPWLSQIQYINFVLQPYEKALAQLAEALTPPNPIQDLLDQEVEAYNQTGDLIGEAVLRVIDEAIDTLSISEVAQTLIDKSRQDIAARRQEEEKLKAEKEEADRLLLENQALRIKEQEKANQELRRRNLFFIIASVLAVILFITASVFAFQVNDANAMLESLNGELQSAKATIQASLNVAVEGLQDVGLSIADLTDQAASQRLATEALSLTESNSEISLLLSVEAIKSADTPEAREALLAGLAQYQGQPGADLGEILGSYNTTISTFALNDANTKLALGSQDGEIFLWDLDGQIRQSQTVTGQGAVLDLVFSSDGNRLISGDSDGQVNLYQVSTGDLIQSYSLSSQPQNLAFGLNKKFRIAPESTAGSRALGTDVSRWQGEIDWQKVKDFGVSFVFIKATEGLNLDSNFNENWQGAGKAGLLRGVYHVFRSETDSEAQIQFFYNTVLETGDLGELPPIIDIELEPFSESQVRIALDELHKTFGKTPIIYAPLFIWANNIRDTSWAGDYALWIPQYPSQDWSADLVDQLQTSEPSRLPVGWEDWTFWQFTAKAPGKQLGVTSSQADLNFFNGSLQDLYGFLNLSEIILVTGNTRGEVSLWDTDNGEQIQTLSAGISNVQHLAIDPKGIEIAIVNQDRVQTDTGSQFEYTIILWNPNTNTSRFFTGTTTRISQIAYSPDGNQIAVGSETGSIGLWEIATRQKAYDVLTDCASISSLVFSPDGKTIACGGENGISLIDALTGKQIAFFALPQVSKIQTMAFSPNGENLLASDMDGNVLSLDVDPQSWAMRACEIVGRNFTTEEWNEYIGGEYRSTCGDF